MRGLVLGFDATLGTGLLRGDDGKRYVFAIDDWLARPRPRPGQLVDFELHKGMALEIFVIKNAGPLDVLAPADQFSALARSVARVTRKYTFSAKLLLPLALLALFAFPFLSIDGKEYSGFNTVGYVRDVLASTGTLSAIGSVETREVMEAGRGVIYLYLLLYILPAFAAYKLMRGLQGARGAERLFSISLATILLLAALPLLMNLVFLAMAPTGNPSLKQSVLGNLALQLPAAYLSYSWGAVLAFGLSALGLLDSLRKRRIRMGRPIADDHLEAEAAPAQPASTAVREAPPQQSAPLPAAVDQPTPQPRPVPPRQPRPAGPGQVPLQPVQPQPRPQPAPPLQDAPQQVQPPRPQSAPRPPQPQPARGPVATAPVEVQDSGLFEDGRQRDDRDQISELLKRIREEEGEA